MQIFAGTPVADEMRREILALAFPKEYKKWAGLLQDNTKPMLGEAVKLLSAIPEAAIPAGQQGQLQQFIQAAQQALQPPAQ